MRLQDGLTHRTAQCLQGDSRHGSGVTLCPASQAERPVKEAEVEEYGDDFYGDAYDDLSVSTVAVGPNVTDYDVSCLDGRNHAGAQPWWTASVL